MSSRVGRRTVGNSSRRRQGREEVRRSRSLSPVPPRTETEAPAWARELMKQVADLKSAANCQKSERDPGDASDTDTEFSRPAHRDQYMFNKRISSVLSSIQAQPERAVEYAQKGKNLVAERQQSIRIADVDGWDTVRLFQQKPVVESEADKRRLKEVREQAMARRRANSSRSRRSRSFRERSPLPKDRRVGTSRSPSPRRSWRNERQPFRQARQPGAASGAACFQCGKPGHFQRFCPNRSRQQERFQAQEEGPQPTSC